MVLEKELSDELEGYELDELLIEVNTLVQRLTKYVAVLKEARENSGSTDDATVKRVVDELYEMKAVLAALGPRGNEIYVDLVRNELERRSQELSDDALRSGVEGDAAVFQRIERRLRSLVRKRTALYEELVEVERLTEQRAQQRRGRRGVLEPVAAGA